MKAHAKNGCLHAPLRGGKRLNAAVAGRRKFMPNKPDVCVRNCKTAKFEWQKWKKFFYVAKSFQIKYFKLTTYIFGILYILLQQQKLELAENSHQDLATLQNIERG